MFLSSLLSIYDIVQDLWLVKLCFTPCSYKFLVLQLFFLKKNYWQWAGKHQNPLLELMVKRDPVHHFRLRSLDLHPPNRAIINPELKAAFPTIPMIQLIIVAAPVTGMGADATMTHLIIVPAPVTDMGADATMLRLVPAPVMDMGADATMLRLVTATETCTGGVTIMDPNSEDERTAKFYDIKHLWHQHMERNCDTPFLAKVSAPSMTPATINTQM